MTDLQTITLDNDNTTAVFTSDGRVFFDLNEMSNILTDDVLRQTLALAEEVEATGVNDPMRAQNILGRVEVVKNIVAQGEYLASLYQVNNITNLSDIVTD